jgi:STE24 endopeptidase
MIDINVLLVIYLAIYLISSFSGLAIEFVNSLHLKITADEVPADFKGILDSSTLKKMNEYAFDKTRLSVIRTVIGKIIFLIIILSGFLPWCSDFLKEYPYIIAGMIFFAIPGIIGGITDLPFEYFHIFHIEERYGFNTRTLKIWVSDLLKSLIIGLILGAILLSLLLVMVRYTGEYWWLWAWIIFFGLQLLMAVIYPSVIAPIFNKFTPIENAALSGKINDLAQKQGLKVKGIFQMDAAKRSRHTNAYFSGLGKTKRIVLYDTLLESHNDDEIIAVLAHEIGHLRKGHIKKQLFIMGIVSLILLFMASIMISWKVLYDAFGFSTMPVYAGLFLIAIIWEPLGFFLSPILMAVSRRYEKEADYYSFKILNTTKPLADALKKMGLDNLSNLRPHPAYVIFNYSHPPLIERIKNLEAMS